MSQAALDAALRIRERIGFSGEGERGMYLCHTFCELGGTPLASILDDIHDFLVSHPNQVLLIINQDSVTPKDFVGAVKQAGLSDLAYTPPAHGAWATLGQMIDRNKRVVASSQRNVRVRHPGTGPPTSGSPRRRPTTSRESLSSPTPSGCPPAASPTAARPALRSS